VKSNSTVIKPGLVAVVMSNGSPSDSKKWSVPTPVFVEQSALNAIVGSVRVKAEGELPHLTFPVLATLVGCRLLVDPTASVRSDRRGRLWHRSPMVGPRPDRSLVNLLCAAHEQRGLGPD
jgi:hypothetical protein